MSNIEAVKKYKLENSIPEETKMLTYAACLKNGRKPRKGEKPHRVKTAQPYGKGKYRTSTMYLFTETQTEAI